MDEKLKAMSLSNFYDLVNRVNVMHGIEAMPKPPEEEFKRRRKRDPKGKYLTQEEKKEQAI